MVQNMMKRNQLNCMMMMMMMMMMMVVLKYLDVFLLLPQNRRPYFQKDSFKKGNKGKEGREGREGYIIGKRDITYK